MADNFPGPYEVEISYTTDGVVHKQRLNCDVSGTPAVGADPATVDLLRRDGMTVFMDLAVAAWAALLAPSFNTADSLDSYILWVYEPLTNNRSYVTSEVLAVSGTSVVASNPAHQETMTFRTFEGGVMRIEMLESIGLSVVRSPYTSAGARITAIMDFVFSDVNWIKARDTSFPIAPLNTTGGQNEAVFKKRYR